MENTRILFVHIPKTAGMSLYNALAQAVGPERAIRFADASKENREKYLAMADDEIRRYFLVSGHFPLAFFRKKPLADYKIITVLRDSVDRELSAYFYMKGWKDHPRHEMISKMDLHAFVTHREADKFPNRQCFILSGANTFEAAKRAIEKRGIFAGPLEHIGDYFRKLEGFLGIGPLALKRDNETPSRLSVEEIPADVRQRLRALTQEDQKLYEYVKRKYEREMLGK